IVQRVGHENQFVVLVAWQDQKAFEAHATRASATEMREKIGAIRNAPIDERVHAGLATGALDTRAPKDAGSVVTHVELIPPGQDAGVALLRQRAADRRSGEGSLRFEVVQR